MINLALNIYKRLAKIQNIATKQDNEKLVFALKKPTKKAATPAKVNWIAPKTAEALPEHCLALLIAFAARFGLINPSANNIQNKNKEKV